MTLVPQAFFGESGVMSRGKNSIPNGLRADLDG
jgi:hypothetical protein